MFRSSMVIFALLACTVCDAQSKSDATQSAAPYKVSEGNKVDTNTLQGWKTWRAMACERCHGAQQEGMVGPSLVESRK